MAIIIKSEYILCVNCYLSNIYISYLFITVNSLKHKHDYLSLSALKIFVAPIYITSEVRVVLVLLHCLSESRKFLSKNVESTANNILGSEDPSRFDSEYELLIALPHLDSSFESLSLSESDTLNAQDALVGVLDLHRVPHLVELVHVARARPHKLLLLLNAQIIVDLVIDPDSGLLAHLAGGDGGPLGVGLARALLGDKVHIELLVLTQLHDQNWILLSPLIIQVHHWHHREACVQRGNVPRSHFHLVLISANYL